MNAVDRIYIENIFLPIRLHIQGECVGDRIGKFHGPGYFVMHVSLILPLGRKSERSGEVN